jgi:hypothetical protein
MMARAPESKAWVVHCPGNIDCINHVGGILNFDGEMIEMGTLAGLVPENLQRHIKHVH